MMDDIIQKVIIYSFLIVKLLKLQLQTVNISTDLQESQKRSKTMLMRYITINLQSQKEILKNIMAVMLPYN